MKKHENLFFDMGHAIGELKKQEKRLEQEDHASYSPHEMWNGHQRL